MSSYGERAKEYFLEGYNCCQSVVLPFIEELGIDKQTALKIASSFGGGFARMREMCGAVSAMGMVAGLKRGYVDAKDFEGKTAQYKLTQELAAEFKDENGSIICRELLGLQKAEEGYVPSKRDDNYYKTRTCADKVKCAAEILAGKLFCENETE